jgi:two-component system, chemotaxis family, protein-glutamate methylesterase/glutaminase
MRTAHKQVAKDFPVVCVGGSAGGLDAYTRLLRNLPADMGVAVVLVNHLRTVSTLLHEILPRSTAMPVKLITEGLVLQPNHVFIIPAQRDLHVLDGEFQLKPISKPRGWPDVITVFLRSLTQHWDGTTDTVERQQNHRGRRHLYRADVRLDLVMRSTSSKETP